ncbi:propionyl-coenzyme A carboxylase alpha polypeptide [Mesorhizobium sp. M1E.F.Ca.ET.045.02.1.1]|nr:propionyl-coenzyme A carboxylase alpha polypeptide [Mesorhizobium sp. M1E.F.Ca.ET.045.02.1.1]RUW82153.1 propionyl-coenzyme A carboxylase alpha polypeptide [Mesorhizobium sp. M1E.F.Ca.ET.063.01.1.1]
MPDISPARGEIGCHLDFRQSPASKIWRQGGTADLPLEGEMAGRPEGVGRPGSAC